MAGLADSTWTRSGWAASANSRETGQTRRAEEMSMTSTVPANLQRRLRLALAGAVVATALTAATAAASTPTPTGPSASDDPARGQPQPRPQRQQPAPRVPAGARTVQAGPDPAWSGGPRPAGHLPDRHQRPRSARR